jgi:hypothetical protein
MTGSELEDVRLAIGVAWGLKRPLHRVEVGRLLRLGGRDRGGTVRSWEHGRTKIPGPAIAALQALLDGWRPHDWQKLVSVKPTQPSKTEGIPT